MRDFVPARAAAVETPRGRRQQVSAFMLKRSRIYPHKMGLTMRYLRSLQEQQWSTRSTYRHPPRIGASEALPSSFEGARDRVEGPGFIQSVSREPDVAQH